VRGSQGGAPPRALSTTAEWRDLFASLANIVRLNVYTTDVDELFKHFAGFTDRLGNSDDRFVRGLPGATSASSKKPGPRNPPWPSMIVQRSGRPDVSDRRISVDLSSITLRGGFRSPRALRSAR
jgi:hypothetical protein